MIETPYLLFLGDAPDALAAKARQGYAGFCRQDFIGADYGLLDCVSGAPLPDFYTALAFTTTLGPTVLNATLSTAAHGPSLPQGVVRAYAHCTALAEHGGKAANGGVTVLVINLANTTVSLHFDNPLGAATRACASLHAC